MLGRWVSHALIYLSVSITASLVWVVLTDGTADDLRAYARTPGDALTVDFWPVWFWLIGGTILAMHAAVVVGRLLPGRRRRHRQKTAIAEQAKAAVEAAMPDISTLIPVPVPASSPGPSTPSPAGTASERRYVVAMFTDLTDSTAVNERIGDDAWAAVVADHRRVVRACTSAHGGQEISTQGDGFFVRFDAPGSAANCATQIQQQCKAARADGSVIPPVRIGIHVGDAVHGDDDVLGRVVNVAARLLEVAQPHQILVTEPVADVIGADRLDDRGLVTLKGMTQPRHVLAVRWDPEAEPAPARRPANTSGRVRRRRTRHRRRR